MLGRGLESLIPNKNNNQSNPPPAQVPPSNWIKPLESQVSEFVSPSRGESIFQIEVEKIKPNPYQPRKIFNQEQLNELSASIREVGIIQPLIVSKVERETSTGTSVEYQLIAGERRLEAAKIAGLERVPAIIRKIGQEKDKLELAIIENIQRADLNPLEAARSYAKLQEEFGLTQREVAARIGKSRETIANVLRLLNLPSYIQDAIASSQISDSQGRLLLAVDDSGQQKRLFDEIIRNNLSVRELRNRVEQMRRSESQPAPAKTAGIFGKDPEITFLESQLEEVLGTKVTLQKTSDGGKITINFFSDEELKEIIRKLIPPNDSQFS